MARASGPATDGLLPGEFTHAASGVHYRLFLRDGRAWLSYDRPDQTLKGEQELSYFIGSGGRGRQSCHGDAAVHLASGGTAPILNPAKLPPTKRDSICLQCHLEGETAVNLPGRSLAGFQPGENLSDYVTHFVHSGELGPEGRATSQWEALLQSECKKKKATSSSS